jgi:hypothetical protein
LNPLRLQRELADNPAIAQRWKKFLKRQAELMKSKLSASIHFFDNFSSAKALSPLPLLLQRSMATRQPSCPA